MKNNTCNLQEGRNLEGRMTCMKADIGKQNGIQIRRNNLSSHYHVVYQTITL